MLAHIENIANGTTAARPQVWKLNGRTPGGQHPEVFLRKPAKQAGLDPLDLRKEAMPIKELLERDPLEG